TTTAAGSLVNPSSGGTCAVDPQNVVAEIDETNNNCPPNTVIVSVPIPQADLAISKGSSPNPYVPGAPLTYTIVVSNAGPSNVSKARVQDTLPAPLGGFGWTCTASGAGAGCGTLAGTGSIDALVTLPAGTHVTFTVSGTVPAATTGALSNTATV